MREYGYTSTTTRHTNAETEANLRWSGNRYEHTLTVDDARCGPMSTSQCAEARNPCIQ